MIFKVSFMLQGEENSDQRVCFQNFCAWDEGCQLWELGKGGAKIDGKTCKWIKWNTMKGLKAMNFAVLIFSFA